MRKADRLFRNPRAAAALAAALLALSLPAPAGAQSLGDVERGRAYAERVCAECHAVRPGDVRSAHPDATPFSVMARVPGVNERALAVFLRTPHANMPNLIVPDDDRDDLIAYFMTLVPKR